MTPALSTRRLPRFISGLIIGAVIIGGVTYAAIPDTATGKITACVITTGPTKGAVRIIDPTNGGVCNSAERRISWQSNAPRYRGAYSAATSYVSGDIVTYKGRATSLAGLRPPLPHPLADTGRHSRPPVRSARPGRPGRTTGVP